MGYWASYADVVEECFIKEKCPAEFDAFKKLRDAFLDTSADIPELRNLLRYGDGDCDELSVAYQVLCQAFNKKTGLLLEIDWHDQDEEGDIYDEVNGEFWHVDGVYKLTQAGKKYADKIERKHYVTFG